MGLGRWAQARMSLVACCSRVAGGSFGCHWLPVVRGRWGQLRMSLVACCSLVAGGSFGMSPVACCPRSRRAASDVTACAQLRMSLVACCSR